MVKSYQSVEEVIQDYVEGKLTQVRISIDGDRVIIVLKEVKQ